VAHFRRTGSVLQGTARGECTGFEIRLAVRTGEDANAVRQVLEIAHATCYTESCLRGEIPLLVTHELNGLPLDPASKP
jgi:hypothetical protein